MRARLINQPVLHVELCLLCSWSQTQKRSCKRYRFTVNLHSNIVHELEYSHNEGIKNNLSNWTLISNIQSTESISFTRISHKCMFSHVQHLILCIKLQQFAGDKPATICTTYYKSVCLYKFLQPKNACSTLWLLCGKSSYRHIYLLWCL